MESFESYFDRNSRLDTPNTRKHHQSAIRSPDRKHLNQVARSQGQQAKHPLIDQMIKSGRGGQRVIDAGTAEQILKAYNIAYTPGAPIEKDINRTGIKIQYNPQGQSVLIKA